MTNNDSAIIQTNTEGPPADPLETDSTTEEFVFALCEDKYKNADGYLEVPLSKFVHDEGMFPLPNVSFEVKEKFNASGVFQEAEIFVEIDEDPRLKAFCIWCSFYGVHIGLIKHCAAILSCGPWWSFYRDPKLAPTTGMGNYVIVPGQVFDDELDEGLFPPLEFSGEEGEVGMLRGREILNFSPLESCFNYYCQEHFILHAKIFESMEGGGDFCPTDFALHSGNVLCEHEFSFTESNPIPYSKYHLEGFFVDTSLFPNYIQEKIKGNLEDRPENYSITLATADFEPKHLAYGIITSVTKLDSFGYDYGLTTMTGKSMVLRGILPRYEIGRYVIATKQQDSETWYLSPSSKQYCEQVVSNGPRIF